MWVRRSIRACWPPAWMHRRPAHRAVIRQRSLPDDAIGSFASVTGTASECRSAPVVRTDLVVPVPAVRHVLIQLSVSGTPRHIDPRQAEARVPIDVRGTLCTVVEDRRGAVVPVATLAGGLRKVR